MKNRYNKLLAIITVVAFVFVSISYSVAYLVWSSEKPLVNLFTKSLVHVEIQEEFDGDIKRNIEVKNEGTIDVYIRVSLNPSWLICNAEDLEDSEIEKNCETLGEMADPVTINVPSSWILIDGYYYYKAPLAPNTTTETLVNDVGIKAPEHSNPLVRYKLDVVSSSIQANPQSTVEDAWNVRVEDSQIVGAR